MNSHRPSTALPAVADPAEPPTLAVRRTRSVRVATLVGAATVLATTAVLAAMGPKLPPFQGE